MLFGRLRGGWEAGRPESDAWVRCGVVRICRVRVPL